MEIDPCVSNWVWEFLLKQPLEDQILSSLLRSPPLPDDRPDLPKTLLLKRLGSDVSRNSVSENALELLEQIEEIEFRRGIETVPDAMRRAYCAVAVESTLKHLKVKDDGVSNTKFMFFESVKRVWRKRIGRMEKELGRRGLVSEELWEWSDEIEAAVWDDSVLESVMKKSKALNAVEAVSVYLREEREKIGPSFLELLCEKAKDDSVIKEMAGLTNAEGVAEEGRSVGVGSDKENNESKEAHEKKIQPRNKLVGNKRPRGTKITDSDETLAGPSKVIDSGEIGLGPRFYKLPRSAEVNNIRKALESSSMELREIVKDPLPEAVRVAEALRSRLRKGKGNDSVEENRVQANVLVVDDWGVVQETRSCASNKAGESVKEQNGSVQTSREDLPDSRDKIHSRSPRKTQALSKDEIESLKCRRKRRAWSLVEEDTLRTGVKKYGVGNWKLILTIYDNVFDDRTDVDLKDKWRNMTRYKQF